jgi:methyltransferase (TIGR00027 family)
MALFRALETMRAADDRMFADPFARAFLAGPWAAVVALSRFRPLGRALERYIDARVAGARSSGVARTKLIDDRVGDALAAGAEQLVLLGAGFDCRALRLPALSGVPVYEVDRGALLARKGDRLARFGEVSGARRVPVPVDFQRDDLAEALKLAGFEAERRAVLLCEGVTNYLNERAVDVLFAFAGHACAPGSRFLFTYVHADVLRGRFPAPSLGALFAKLRESSEPWTFGFRPEELPAFCATHGLRLVEDLGAAEYRAVAMGERARGLAGYEFYRLAVAEVARA